MRIWSRNTGRAALVAASAIAVGAAFGTAVPANAVGALYGGSHGGGRDVDMKSIGNFGTANGAQAFAPISMPIDVCGNALAISGLALAKCKGGASIKEGGGHRPGYRTADGWGGGEWGGSHGHGGRSVDMTSAGNVGLLNGSQVYAPISMPINVCGNSLGVFGAAQAKCKGGASVKGSGEPKKVKMTTTGNFGAGNGTQAYAPVKAPINVCGNAASLFGIAEAECKGGATVEEGHGPKEHPRHHPHKKPKKKHCKCKHRPAAKHKKLPSTMRAEGSRIANVAPNQRIATAAPKQRIASIASNRRIADVAPKQRIAGIASNQRGAQIASNQRRADIASPRRGAGIASPQRGAGVAPNYRSAAAMPAVQGLLDSLKGIVKVPGVDAKPGQIGPKSLVGKDAPVKLGSQLLR
ncbi:chaplin family protein [Actinomadura sp. WMMA1423]|uniref:chaplin family protein n=1 Tax=Actinomadura sp. WMMA1423 TaxID=2591108 RepID=UPI00143D4B1C|nr:chaplin family protein [Actinomadura sp. WMMA1423]